MNLITVMYRSAEDLFLNFKSMGIQYGLSKRSAIPQHLEIQKIGLVESIYLWPKSTALGTHSLTLLRSRLQLNQNRQEQYWD